MLSRTRTLTNTISLGRLFSTAGSGNRLLVTGALGQIGSELVPLLRSRYGAENVIATDLKPTSGESDTVGPYHQLDVTNTAEMISLVEKYKPTTIVHLATLLSAVGEKNPQLAIKVNAGSIQSVLEIARANKLKVFAPSTIAVFGPTTPLDFTPDNTTMQPSTIYGVTKVYLELLGNYYHRKFGVDFRSLRYPGVISNVVLPGGGTTDYAVDIYYKALQTKKYTCFIDKDVALPMIYMPDCLKATVDIMDAPNDNLKQRVYNVTAMSFTPTEIAKSVKKYIPEFEMDYSLDFRNEIAKSWPRALDDSLARRDWNWQPDYDLDRMSADMFVALSKKLNVPFKL